MDSRRPNPAASSPAAQAAARRILWASFLFSLLVYGVLGYTLLSGAGAPSLLPSWLWPLAAAGFAAGAFLIPGVVAGPIAAREKAGVATPFRLPELIGWAFAEAVGLVGFVSVLLGSPREPLVLYLAAAAAILWFRRPTD